MNTARNYNLFYKSFNNIYTPITNIFFKVSNVKKINPIFLRQLSNINIIHQQILKAHLLQ